MTRMTLGATLLAAALLLPAASAPAYAQGWLDDARGMLDQMQGTDADPTGLSQSELSGGLKEALRVAADRVVSRLGQAGGFSQDPQVHIPLPEGLKQVKSVLSRVGMGSMLEDLEQRLNRGAELAVADSKDLFVDAIKQMTLEDARAIYEGPDDAATRYFQEKMSGPLAERMRPVVADTLQQAGAVETYDQAMGEYKQMPFVPDVQTDLTGYVVDQAQEGLFHYLAEEEAAIRQNPAKRTTELLRKVFGS